MTERRDHSPLVFVVDDDPSIVRTIDGFLKRAGFRTESAGDVAGALQGIRAKRPDLVLLDVNLPDGSGFDVCKTLSHEASALATPVLFISANEDTSTKVRGFEVGGVDYITKPIVGAEVVARVRTHLRLKRAFERLAELQAERLQQLASAQNPCSNRRKNNLEDRSCPFLRRVQGQAHDDFQRKRQVHRP